MASETPITSNPLIPSSGTTLEETKGTPSNTLPYNSSRHPTDVDGKPMRYAFTWEDEAVHPDPDLGIEVKDAREVYPKMIFFPSEREREYVYDLCSPELREKMLYIEYFPEEKRIKITSPKECQIKVIYLDL